VWLGVADRSAASKVAACAQIGARNRARGLGAGSSTGGNLWIRIGAPTARASTVSHQSMSSPSKAGPRFHA
jgi:hypothetical protein